MLGFEDAWLAVSASRNGEAVSPELRPLLERVYIAILSNPTALVELKTSLQKLLEFLAGAGRTNANCWATDLFFCLSEGWERDWTDQNLPDAFHDVLALMGQALHDTVRTPHIAENFDCLPEQLLERIKRLQIDNQEPA